MDALRAIHVVPSAISVNERKGGQKQADAFRRALQQQDGERASGEQREEQPVRRPLQLPTPIGRRDAGAAQHVDVIA